eukprot:3166829-Rhodomonas_salina.1
MPSAPAAKRMLADHPASRIPAGNNIPPHACKTRRAEGVRNLVGAVVDDLEVELEARGGAVR